MGFENIIALVAVLFSLIVFLQLGISASKRTKNTKNYLFAGRNISGIYFQHTLVAGGTSLATVLIFFLTTGRLYGYILLINLATFILGQYFFFYIATNSKIELSNFTTLSNFVLQKSDSKLLFWITRLITIAAFAGVLFIEVLLGVEIFKYFGNVPYIEVIAFSSISILMLSYIALGGFAAVIDSDSWQFKLILVSAGALLITLIFYYRPESWSLTRAISPSATNYQIASLILNATIVNFTLPICQLSSWQRVSAAGNWNKVKENFKTGLWKITFIWLAFIVFSWTISGSNSQISQIGEFFDFLRAQSPVVSYVLYPVIFTGLVSALISTADSAAMAISLEIYQKDESSKRSWNYLRKKYSILALIILASLGVTFYLFHSSARQYFVHLVFVLFSQVIVLFPLIFTYIKYDKEVNTYISSAGLVLGFIFVWISSIIGMFETDLAWTQFASAIGLTISFIFIIWAKNE